MKILVSFAALVVSVAGQSTFEPADFNVTEALLDNGVNVSALPDLAPLVDRASTSGCSAAVSSAAHDPSSLLFADRDAVQVSRTHLWPRQTRGPTGVGVHLFHRIVLVCSAARDRASVCLQAQQSARRINCDLDCTPDPMPLRCEEWRSLCCAWRFEY